MEDVTISQQTTFELEETYEWLESSLEISTYSTERTPFEAPTADPGEASVEAEAVRTARQYVKRRAFLSVLAVVVSALLLAVIVRRQMQLVETLAPIKILEALEKELTHASEVPKEAPSHTLAKSKVEPTSLPEVKEAAELPEVPKEDSEQNPIASKVKSTGILGGSKEDAGKTPAKPRAESLLPEEKIDDLVEWVRRMPAPGSKTYHRAELENNKFEEVVRIDGLKYTFSGVFRKLTPSYDPDEMAASVAEGVPKLVEKCSPNAEEARRLSREHMHYRFFGNWEHGEVLVSVTGRGQQPREGKVNWAIAAHAAAVAATAARG
ncbi:hypothetical protein Emed_006184 [Eimeria media]